MNRHRKRFYAMLKEEKEREKKFWMEENTRIDWTREGLVFTKSLDGVKIDPSVSEEKTKEISAREKDRKEFRQIMHQLKEQVQQRLNGEDCRANWELRVTVYDIYLKDVLERRKMWTQKMLIEEERSWEGMVDMRNEIPSRQDAMTDILALGSRGGFVPHLESMVFRPPLEDTMLGGMDERIVEVTDHNRNDNLISLRCDNIQSSTPRDGFTRSLSGSLLPRQDDEEEEEEEIDFKQEDEDDTPAPLTPMRYDIRSTNTEFSDLGSRYYTPGRRNIQRRHPRNRKKDVERKEKENEEEHEAVHLDGQEEVVVAPISSSPNYEEWPPPQFQDHIAKIREKQKELERSVEAHRKLRIGMALHLRSKVLFKDIEKFTSTGQGPDDENQALLAEMEKVTKELDLERKEKKKCVENNEHLKKKLMTHELSKGFFSKGFQPWMLIVFVVVVIMFWYFSEWFDAYLMVMFMMIVVVLWLGKRNERILEKILHQNNDVNEVKSKL